MNGFTICDLRFTPRSAELRFGAFVVTLRRIPTGFHQSAQGCEVGPSGSDRATLGQPIKNIFNPNGVASPFGARGFNPFRVDACWTNTQGSSFLATLGWMTQSLWDSWTTRFEVLSELEGCR